MTTRTDPPKPPPRYFRTLRPHGDYKLRPPKWHTLVRYEHATWFDGVFMVPVAKCGRKSTSSAIILMLLQYRLIKPKAELLCKACQNR